MAGIKRMKGAIHVLDGFHLETCLTKLTSHMKDKKDDAKQELRDCIRNQTKADFIKLIDRLEERKAKERRRPAEKERYAPPERESVRDQLRRLQAEGKQQRTRKKSQDRER